MKKEKERDNKGRYAKGHKGGPGRPKGEPKDIIGKAVKKGDMTGLLNALLETYAKLGGDKFFFTWAKRSHGNLNEFMKLLFRFVPQPGSSESDIHKMRFDFGEGLKVERVLTDERPDENAPHEMPKPDSPIGAKILKLQAEIRAKDKEIDQLKARLSVQEAGEDLEEIKHRPIRPIGLPEHDEDREIEEMTDEELDEAIEWAEKEAKDGSSQAT